MSFLRLENRKILVTGLSTRRSVAFFVGEALKAEGAQVAYTVHTQVRRDELEKRAGNSPLFIYDAKDPKGVAQLKKEIFESGFLLEKEQGLHGLVHSIAYANYSNSHTTSHTENGLKPFHETTREDFAESLQISCHSLLELSNALEKNFTRDASVVAMSISTPFMAAENYGFMAPIKAALDSSVVFLAKSFSMLSDVRFNSICAGLLKTNSSAGIPGYVDSYLFAEQATLRKNGLKTEEVANLACFLLSPASSGINAQRIVIDAGMGVNYFDQTLVRAYKKGA